ncbi:ABC transporter substrate-binding protein [Paenibacillus piri]|uniref:Extracellular solute-binding protein n=1 Tax=Paenibacillus piri TaxID=2547395 RepID=A0A4R5KRQ6_9BACL|nr:ABC transporter substrate-binding protein [Paenibacillus piri]TDF97490.1 extracellular solute-binding protein [Paenibacillus piri]
MRKGVTALVSMLTATALLTGACSSAKQNGSEPEAGGSDQVTEAGVFPITKEKTTYKVMIKGSSIVENFATNEFTKWLEEKTNIHLEWEVAPEKSFQEKLNVALASGDYPDILINMSISPIQQSIYGKDGVFIPLNSYIDKYGTETKKMWGQVSYAKDLMTMPDGKIYSLPQINQCYHCSYGQKMFINQTWLKKLGLSMPTTTDEFYEVLKAFKEKDPNGNGKADEIPLVGAVGGPSTTIQQTQLDPFIMSAFVEKDFAYKLVKDGKVQVAYNQPGWKEGLKYLNKLYKEGLIASQSFTQDKNQLKQMGMNPEAPIIGAVPAQNQGNFIEIDSERFKDFVTVPPLKGPSGVQSAPFQPYYILQGQFVITNKAKNPAAAFRLADLLMSEEAALRSTVGRPGQEWDKAADGELGLDGKQAKWKQLTTFGKLQNVHWAQAGPSVRTNEFRLGQYADPKIPLETILYNESKKNYEPYQLDPKKVVPPLFFTNEQSEELANIEKAISDYRAEFFAKSVTGAVDIDKEWDNYLNTLDKMNLKRYIEIHQQAYDEWSKKK